MTSEIIAAKFGNRLRIRVNGIMIENDCLLMVKHKGLGELGYLWAPPGGGMEYGTSAIHNLEREFLEETGIKILVKDFLFVCELNKPALHAIEMYFSVIRESGKLKTGFDPELGEQDQIIEQVSFLWMEDLKLMPQPALHKVVTDIKRVDDLISKRGYFLI